MPTCAHCGKQWSYGETLKRSFRIKMVCPYCDEGNYHSARERKISMMSSILLSPLIIFLGMFLEFSVPWIIITALALGIIIFSVTPFFIDLSKEEEALW